jgi:hypothetical protein
MSGDGAPVVSSDELLGRLRAFVVLGYPQVTLYTWPLTLANLFPVFNAPFRGARVRSAPRGVRRRRGSPAPATGLGSGGHLGRPRRYLGSDHRAAAPAVPSSRIATPVEPAPPVAQ